MKRIFLTSVAALAALSVVTATAPKAHAFFIAPAVAAAAMGGALFTGAVVGSASSNAPYPGQTVVVTPASTVTYGDRACYPTRAVIYGHWRRVYVCE